jgi:hypothetical protein
MAEDFKDYLNCLGCGTLTEKSQLSKGRCIACLNSAIVDAKAAVKRADEHALANVARVLLSGIASVGKGEPTSPAILQAALEELGGVEAFGRMIGRQIKIATGEDISSLPTASQSKWRHSPQIAFKFAELIARLSVRVDERQSVDLSALSQDELVNSLQSLALDLAQTSPEYRELMFKMITQIDPGLIGTTNVVQAGSVAQQPAEKDPLDYEEAGEE